MRCEVQRWRLQALLSRRDGFLSTPSGWRRRPATAVSAARPVALRRMHQFEGMEGFLRTSVVLLYRSSLCADGTKHALAAA